MSKCAECAKMQTTCCEYYEVILTPGDIKRIYEYTGVNTFYKYSVIEDKNRVFQCNPDVPAEENAVYFSLVINEARKTITLNHDNYKCTFLTDTGCLLPFDVRPIICRIYPYSDWTETKPRQLYVYDELCPSILFDGYNDFINTMCMPKHMALKLIDDFYKEYQDNLSDIK